MDKEPFIDFEEGEKFLASDHKTFLKRFYEIEDGGDRYLENEQIAITFEPFNRLSPYLTGK